MRLRSVLHASAWLCVALLAGPAPIASATAPPLDPTLTAWYAARGDQPAWFQGTQLTRSAAALLGEMRAAEARGLDSDDYGGNAFARTIAGLSSRTDGARMRELDRAFTLRAARFIGDLHFGRVTPKAAGHDLEVPHARLDLGTVLAALASTGDTTAVLDDYEPGLRHYSLLKIALQSYRELAQEPGLTDLPALPRRSVKPGEQYLGMAALRRLLVAVGDLSADTPVAAADETLLDSATMLGLARFQQRHGLTTDGALGASTYAALTRPMRDRVRQIELSLERARWLPPRLDSPPIIVNIPQFKLFAFYTALDREDAMLAMNVIVGKTFPSSNTPVFAADMRYVVLRPYWDVPASILRQEFLPKIRANPGWIARNDFEIVAGQGDDGRVIEPGPDSIADLARGALRLRQKPGPNNALGLAKFMFPNRHNVYLHSTPAQALFAQSRRAFSHGCVRVEYPTALAEYVLRSDPAWTRDAILAAQQDGNADGRPMRINLAQPIRVMMVYATAIAAESGQVLFFEDIYRHDTRLVQLLGQRRPLPPL